MKEREDTDRVETLAAVVVYLVLVIYDRESTGLRILY
jgi:hypothetical protein